MSDILGEIMEKINPCSEFYLQGFNLCEFCSYRLAYRKQQKLCEKFCGLQDFIQNFCGFCFIPIESAATAESIHRENFRNLSKICKKHKAFSCIAFCRFQYFYSINRHFAALVGTY